MLGASTCSPRFWSLVHDQIRQNQKLRRRNSYRSVINSLVLDSSRKPRRSSGASLKVSVGLLLHCLCDNRTGFNKGAKDFRISGTSKENKGPPLVLYLCTWRWTIHGYSTHQLVCKFKHVHNAVDVGLQNAPAEKRQRVSDIANCMSRNGLSVDERLPHAGKRLVLTRT